MKANFFKLAICFKSCGYCTERNMTEWYYVDADRQQAGPRKVGEMKTLWEKKTIDADTLVWNEDQEGWKTIESIPGLLKALRQATRRPSVAPPPVPKVPTKLKAPEKSPRQSVKKVSNDKEKGSKSPVAPAKKKSPAAPAKKSPTAPAASPKAKAKRSKSKASPKMALKEDGWNEIFTPNGVPYYLHGKTGELSWDKPPELAGDEDENEKAENWLFVTDPEEGYIPLKVTGDGQGMTLHGRRKTYVEKDVYEKITAKSLLLKLEDDLVHMKEVNEATITHCLRERFLKDQIYTSIGDIIISINPWKGLPLYTPEIIDQYAHHSGEKLPPHVFDTARRSYAEVVDHQGKVSVLISGESGAGKTEATKQILTYLSEVAGGTSNIAAKLLAANPVLEAFGNAKTLRNNNSSRFGKYMQVYFDAQSRIESCYIKNYLLEGSRLVLQPNGERSFHIFYQLCAGLNEKTKDFLKLGDARDYAYLNSSGCIKIDGMDDKEEFEDVEAALTNLGFGDDERTSMLKISAAVLHLGNVIFESIEGESGHVSKIADSSSNGLSIISSLLGVDVNDLKRVLIQRQITLRGETMSVELSKEKAEHGRDAFAKKIYGFLFNWIVQRINKSMSSRQIADKQNDDDDQAAYVGILDIFGFEIFEVNSFEQLCINFCNEKLQQHFNTNTFRSEEELYLREGIPFDHIEYKDNQDVLDLIEKKPSGILVVLDDEVSVPRGSDKSFLNKLSKRQKKHPRFVANQRARNKFGVNHYAGKVEYTIDNFCEKNKDRLEEDVASMLTESKEPLVEEIMSETKTMLDLKKKGMSTTRATRYRTRTQGGQFRLSLNSLMAALNTTKPYYVRCVKSNNIKKPGVFNGKMCLEQLRYAGVFEAVRIRMQGYPFRYDHEHFFKRFKCLAPPPDKMIDSLNGCQYVIEKLSRVDKDLRKCHVGHSMVLYRSKQNAILELRRVNLVREKVVVLQCAWRGVRGRRLVKAIRFHVPILEKAIAKRDKGELETAINNASGLWFEPRVYKSAVFILQNLEKEVRIRKELSTLETMDPDKNYEEFQEVVNKVKDIQKHDNGAFQDDLSIRVVEIFSTVEERREVIKDLKLSTKNIDKDGLEGALERLEAVKERWGNDFCAAEEREAQRALERVRKEEQYAREIMDFVTKEGVTGEAGALSTNTSVAVHLKESIDVLEKFEAHVPAAIEALKQGRIVLTMREMVATALASEESIDSSVWNDVQNAVAAANEIEFVATEVNLIKEEIALRSKIDDVVKKLEVSLEEREEDRLVLCLEQGLALGLPTHSNGRYREIYYDAQRIAQQLGEIRSILEDGMRTKNIKKLNAGIEKANKIKFTSSSVRKAQGILDEIRRTTVFGDNAIESANITELRIFLERCIAQKLNLPKRQTRAKEILALPESKLLQLQLKCALKKEEMGRVTEITLRIKEIFFLEHGGKFQFSSFINLKRRSQFAKRYGVSQDHLRRNMLQWTDEPIHTSLTNMDDLECKRLATRYFKNILGYMGDRQYSYPVLLGHEVIQAGIEHVGLRDEIYCQMTKQLIKNPSPASQRRGWNLMALALSSFPPSDELENFLEMFLRENDQLRSVRKLHKIIFGGALPEAISLGHMERIQSKGARFSIVERGEGKNHRFSVAMGKD